jgi:hypothetical protein
VRRGRSLRARLTYWYTGVLAATLGVYACVVLLALTRHLYDDLDLHLHEEIEVAVHRIEIRADGTAAWRDETSTVEEEPGGERWLEAWDENGRRLVRWASTAPVDLGPMDVRSIGRTIVLSDGRTVRVLTKTAVIGGRRLWLRAARSQAPTETQLWNLFGGLGLALPVVLLAAGLVGLIVGRRLLAPLTTIAARAEAITAERLD